MNRKLTTFLASVATLTALSFTTAGSASAFIVSATITPTTLVTQSWTNNNSNDVTYTSAFTAGAPAARIWNPGLPGGNRGFSGTNFTLTENSSVTLKVNQYDVGVSHTIYPLSELTFYLYAGGFSSTAPTTNLVSVGGVNSWDGSSQLTLDLLAGTTYTFVVTTDKGASSIPALPSGQNWVTSEITASPIPIPAAAWLLGSGLVGLLGVRKKSAEF